MITGLSNFATVPALYVVKKQNMIYQFYIGIFTLLTSFMYHTLESFDCSYFIIEEGGWHRLDNIGSITCFQMLFTQLSDFQNLEFETILNYFGLLVTMICQAKSPWDLNYTIGPILLQALICLLVILKRKRLPKLIKAKLQKGFIVSLFAALFFTLSQDEFKDYLRFYHGMWHVCVGVFSFYMWQTKCDVEFTWSNFYKIPCLKDTYYKNE
ncbi:unnamed protein product [Paramecium octaurelia]|uniref:Uncharacterized protein n=1 Tax=Paramecium octaurelia TaxID=43137 RepID=A0A8S1S474_PAROT|nr:unnamed protein product [Paramecium octaurelia]